MALNDASIPEQTSVKCHQHLLVPPGNICKILLSHLFSPRMWCKREVLSRFLCRHNNGTPRGSPPSVALCTYGEGGKNPTVR